MPVLQSLLGHKTSTQALKYAAQMDATAEAARSRVAAEMAEAMGYDARERRAAPQDGLTPPPSSPPTGEPSGSPFHEALSVARVVITKAIHIHRQP